MVVNMSSIAFLEPYVRSTESSSEATDKASLVQALIMSALKKIEQARQANMDGKPVQLGFYIGRATAIVDALRDALDLESGGQAAKDYDRVYEHIDLCLQIAVVEATEQTLGQAREAICHLAVCWRANRQASDLLSGTA